MWFEPYLLVSMLSGWHCVWLKAGDRPQKMQSFSCDLPGVVDLEMQLGGGGYAMRILSGKESVGILGAELQRQA